MTVLEDTLTEGMGFAEALAKMYKGAPVATDTLSLPIGLSAVRAKSDVLTDGIGIAPSVPVLRYAISTIVDAIRIQHAETINGIYRDTLVDGIGVMAVQGAGIPATLTDGIGVELAQLIAIGQVVTEALYIEPEITPNTIRGVTLTQGMRFRDLLAQFVAADILETIGVEGALSVVGLFSKSLEEDIGIEDVITPTFLISATCEETIGIEDLDVLTMIFNGQLAENIRITAAYVAPNGGFTTWAINAATGAVTEYTNYQFNSFAQVGDKYIGASSEGLYELSGSDDDGEDIVARIKSGLIQLVGSRFVGFKAAYLGIRANTTTAPIQFYLKIVTGDGTERVYNVLANSMQTTKVNIGKGVRTRYWSFELVSFGDDFDLESIEFVPMVANRRV